MSVIGCVGDGVGEVSYEWRVPDFFSLSDRARDYYLSPDFSFADTSWCLRLYQNIYAAKSSGYLSVYLVRKEAGPPKTLHFSLGVKGREGRKRGEKDFIEKDQSWGFPFLVSRSELKDRKSTLVPNGVLTVTCDLRNNGPSADESAWSNRVLKVVHSLKTMLVEGKRADFTLKLGGREWPVHKAILETRCQYFENMFRHKWVEGTAGEVTFEDIEECGLESVLEFIYTGDVEIMSVENICEIYMAAHKFLLEDLKTLCIQWMKRNMCLEIVCKVLLIAHTYDEKDLNEIAIGYFVREAGKILDSDQWKQLRKDHVTVVADFLEEITRRELKKGTK